MLDLQRITEEEGDSISSPRKLCDNVLWHMKQVSFQPCPCTAPTATRVGHHDPVQALFPAKFRSRLRKKLLPNLELQGAVIFGHSMNLHWHWRDTGDPVEGDPPTAELCEPLEMSQDSGLGSSLDSSGGISLNEEGSSTPSLSVLTPPSVGSPPSSAILGAKSGTLSRHQKGAKRSFQDVVTSINKKVRFL
jgi:hypothetical protein